MAIATESWLGNSPAVSAVLVLHFCIWQIGFRAHLSPGIVYVYCGHKFVLFYSFIAYICRMQFAVGRASLRLLILSVSLCGVRIKGIP